MLGGLALGLAATPLEAAEPRYRLQIPETSFAEALIELGVQARVSIVGVSACGAGGRVGLSGAATLEAALRALTAGAPCSYQVLDPRTVRIAAAPRAPAAAPVRSATLVAELMVTATKRPAEVRRLPASVSVVSHDQIELTGAAGVGDTVDQVSGVLTTNLGPGRDKLILRGLSDGAFTGRARSTVGSYLDNVPINYNAPDPDLPLVDVDRIEVVRGPQGALYGSGAVSGVYRIVTRKPDLSEAAFGAAALYAETSGGSPSDEVEAYGSVPLIHDRLALRLVGYEDVEGGYIDNAELRLSNVDRTTRTGGRAALRLQIDSGWQLDLAATDQRLRSDDTQYVTPSLGPTTRFSRVQEGHKNDFAEASATLRGELGWASLQSTVAFIDHGFSSQYDGSSVVDQLGGDPSDLGIYDEQTRIRMLVQDTVLRSARPGRLSWLVGLYGLASTENSPSTFFIQAPGGGSLEQAYVEHRHDRLGELATYGEAGYDLGRGWTASVGGRLFTTEVRTVADIEAHPPGVSRDVAAQKRFSGFSPKLSVQYAFDDSGLVYALVTEGFRPGGFNTGGFLFPFKSGRESFEPDRLRNYELGLKARLLDHRLALRSALFFDQWKDIQTDQYRPSGLPYTANVGDADVEGLESEADYDFGFGLSLQANVLFANSKLTRANPDFAPQVTSGLPDVPKVSAGLVAIYQRPLPRSLTLRLVGETSYVGGSALSFDATNTSTQGRYARTKLSAQIASRAWSATLFVTNPANSAGDTFAYGNPFTFGQVRQSTPQRPRTIGLRLAANY
ncbi:MAG TPA: TonB-dependent receptor [Phenylobacterium sp.]|nr:TonB-dependent receptor [Phenylobacterium sp.]